MDRPLAGSASAGDPEGRRVRSGQSSEGRSPRRSLQYRKEIALMTMSTTIIVHGGGTRTWLRILESCDVRPRSFHVCVLYEAAPLGGLCGQSQRQARTGIQDACVVDCPPPVPCLCKQVAPGSLAVGIRLASHDVQSTEIRILGADHQVVTCT
jgi:hypothetical protein